MNTPLEFLPINKIVSLYTFSYQLSPLISFFDKTSISGNNNNHSVWNVRYQLCPNPTKRIILVKGLIVCLNKLF